MVKVKKVVSVLRDVKIGNQEVTPQAIWPTAKSLVKQVGPKAPITIYDTSGLRMIS